MPIETSQIIVDGEIKIDKVILTFERTTAQISYVEVIKDENGVSLYKQQGFVPKDVAIPWLIGNMPSAQVIFNKIEQWRSTKLPPGATVNLLPNTDVDISIGG
jgi:hypothetical protein